MHFCFVQDNLFCLFFCENMGINCLFFFFYCALAGQTAASSQGPSDTEQEVLPPHKKSRKRGRPRKTINNQDKSPAKMKSATSEAPVNHDSPVIPESPEMTPSGRPKRKAAKV